MKKWLILFVLVDFIFVGLVLRISTQNERQIASVDELSEGQQQKISLAKSFQFYSDNKQLVLQSDLLQMICDTSALIEIKFTALNVAYAGIQPNITHTFSCADIKKDQSTNALRTKIDDFKAMHKNKKLSLAASSLIASQVYSDEDFPADWKITEITVTGPNTFSINQFEIEQTHDIDAFNFTITSLK